MFYQDFDLDFSTCDWYQDFKVLKKCSKCSLVPVFLCCLPNRSLAHHWSQVGQKAFFYHSNTKPPGIIGLVEVVREAYTDHTQFDSKDPHYDSKSKEVLRQYHKYQ